MRAIVVGLGGRARSWIDTCLRSDSVTPVAYVDPVAELRERVVEQYEVSRDVVFADLQTAIGAVEADFIIDVTPPAVHERVAMEAFEAGLDVLGEKPMSDDFAASRRMAAAAQDSGRTHMITQNYRFTLTPRTTRRLLASGVIGAPEQVSVLFFMPWATRIGTHYTELPYMLLKDMGIHHFDLLRYVLAREPVSVQCVTWNPSWGWHKGDASHTAIFEFEEGVMATHQAFGSSVGRKTAWNGEWQIDGPEGSITWENDRIFRTRSFPADAALRDEIPHDDLRLTGQDAILAEFVSAVAEHREPECSSRDNLHSLAMTTAAVLSAAEQRRVEIAELLE